MTNKSIRLLMLVAFIGAIGIIITQTYWVRKAYQLQEKEFELKANLALRNVASNIAELKHIQLPIYSSCRTRCAGTFSSSFLYQTKYNNQFLVWII